MTTALITGAAGGIGRGVSLALADLGIFTILAGHRLSTLSELYETIMTAPNAGASIVTVDVGDMHSVDRLYAQSPPIDILINLAAAPAVNRPIEFISFTDYQHTMRTDVAGTFLMCQGAARKMKAYANGGRIINFSSYHALGSYPNRSVYATAKAAVVGLTQQLAVELGPFGITVNAVLPGAIETPRTATTLANDTGLRDGLIHRTPMGHLGTVDDIAAVVVFLVSDGAQHITGQSIVVDGGYTRNLYAGR